MNAVAENVERLRNSGCLVSGCERLVLARGLCAMHYQRWARHGDPLAGRTPKGDPLKFVEHVALQHTSDECLVWPFKRDSRGYGRVWVNGRFVGAHQEVCRRAHGEAPSPAHEVAHSCGKGHLGCVNPTHLRWATHRENLLDRIAHGTSNRGTRQGQAKLTEGAVRFIRKNRTLTTTQLARRFGVHFGTIRHVENGSTWSWLR